MNVLEIYTYIVNASTQKTTVKLVFFIRENRFIHVQCVVVVYTNTLEFSTLRSENSVVDITDLLERNEKGVGQKFNLTNEFHSFGFSIEFNGCKVVIARKRSLGQGIFTCVCHSVHRGRGWLSSMHHRSHDQHLESG